MYGTAAAWRRRWYAADPTRRRALTRPVVSIGALRVGGSGKTPAVQYIARLLRDAGERPAILTRGYARARAGDGVTVVADYDAVHADIADAGDEPLMLAQSLSGVAVLVSADRYLAGRVAEQRLGATVHVLDDGFQHFALERSVDLLLASEDDLADRPLPAGRLREDIRAAAVADAVLATAGYDAAAERVARALGVGTAFRIVRSIGAPRRIAGERHPVVVPAGTRVYVACGIAQPERFTADVAAAGWEIVGEMHFRDHHVYTARDVQRISQAAQTAATAIVLTTDKDAVRLRACDLGDLPIASVPLVVTIEPVDRFRSWLLARLESARAVRAGADPHLRSGPAVASSPTA